MINDNHYQRKSKANRMKNPQKKVNEKSPKESEMESPQEKVRIINRSLRKQPQKKIKKNKKN